MKEILLDLIRSYPEKYSVKYHPATKWGEPLIKVADANDPLFEGLKTIISPTHALPGELVDGARSVITWYVPFDTSIARSNIPGEESSLEWDYAYVETNNMLNDLSKEVHDMITAMGYAASDIPATYNYDPIALKSDWSHRSAAFIAGLGTFGINNMLITEKGCCGRFGSVITTMPFEADKRPGREYCLFKYNGSCGACIDRCPIKAYTLDQSRSVKVSGSQLELGGAAEYGVFYDRHLCNEQIFKNVVHFENGDGDTCGKCMVGMPCSHQAPSAKLIDVLNHEKY